MHEHGPDLIRPEADWIATGARVDGRRGPMSHVGRDPGVAVVLRRAWKLAQAGDVAGAEREWRRADELGDAIGARHLGLLLRDRGEREEAEAALRRGDERGDAIAASTLGVLLVMRGDRAGAEAAWRRADERGLAGGTFNLGGLLFERGDLAEAEVVWRRADERGHAGAAERLARILSDRGDTAGAEAAWRRADQRGDGTASFRLGLLVWQRGDAAGALAAFERAEARGFEGAALFADDVRSGVRTRLPAPGSQTLDFTAAEELLDWLSRPQPAWLRWLAGASPRLAARITFSRMKRRAAHFSSDQPDPTAPPSKAADRHDTGLA